MSYVTTKPGVQFATIAPAGFAILAALDKLAFFLPAPLVITSGTDFHTAPDPHATGNAYDVSVAGFDAALIVALYHRLQAYLSAQFTVLYEVPAPPLDPTLGAIAYVNPHATAPHFHVQLKNGVTYAPSEAGHAADVRA